MDSGGLLDLSEPFSNRGSLVTPVAPSSSRRLHVKPCLVILAMRATDVSLLSLALIMSCAERSSGLDTDKGPIIVGGSGAIAMICFCLKRGGAYQLERQLGLATRARLLLTAVSVGAGVFSLCLSMLHALGHHGALLAIWACLTFTLLSAAAAIWGCLLDRWRVTGALDQRIAVVGFNQVAKRFMDHVIANPDTGLRVLGVYNDEIEPSGGETEQSGAAVCELIQRSRNEPIDAIVLAVPLYDMARIDLLRHALRDVTADIYALPDLGPLPYSSSGMGTLGGCPVLCLSRRPLDDWQQFQKAVFDRFVAAILCAILLPTLVLIALAIRLETTGPVLFRQPRIGFNNRIFTIYKFRTMIHSLDPASLNGERQARRDDPRITRTGAWLRKLSLDELPQLFNVLKGDMSLVGPRPHPPETRAANQLFRDVVKNYAMRHRVRPGITGWAQVSGWRGETVTAYQIEQRVAHDLYYIEHWSLLLDVRILVLTIVNEIRSNTAF